MLPSKYHESVALIENFLERILPAPADFPAPIHEAVRYSLFAGGKRLRPYLCMIVSETLSGSATDALPVAAAIEMIHTYSLVHDDLPCMDDDDFRRGKLTSHKVFGEAIAILAGDALLTSGFEVLATASYDPAIRCRLISDLTTSIGTRGMIGGQVLDMQSQTKVADRLSLETLHAMKTAALIGFSAKAPAILHQSGEAMENTLLQYGQSIGLAFQIVDDILDVEATSETLGKTAGKDRKQQKVTYPSTIGLDESKILAADLVEAAVHVVREFDRFGYLTDFARFVMNRNK